VQPSRAKRAGTPASSARRRSTKPLIEIGRARKKDDALAGLERWKARHPDAASRLEPHDVLVDAMRGRYTTWTRVRVNLEHVPPHLRPTQEPLDPADAPAGALPVSASDAPRRRSPPARTPA
jgi:bifunctional non-homologous end joining protein LigD